MDEYEVGSIPGAIPWYAVALNIICIYLLVRPINWGFNGSFLNL
jgi:hypothetical protein